MAAQTVLPEQVRDSMDWTALPHMNAGPARNFDFEVICTNWMTQNGSLFFSLERSLDGTNWVPFGAWDKTCGVLGKGATQAIQIQNGKRFGVYWDGQDMDVRAKVDVTPAPFAWGLKML